MFNFLDKPFLIGIAVVAALAAQAFMLKMAYNAGESSALLEAREATERAINELADEADRARVRRRLCIDGGGVWSFADNKCE